jgi:hypothetical protein
LDAEMEAVEKETHGKEYGTGFGKNIYRKE